MFISFSARRRAIANGRFMIVSAVIVAAGAFSASAQLSVQVVGNSIQYSAGGGQQTTTSYCVTDVLIDGRSVLANGNAPPCTTVPTNSGTITCNTVGVHTVSAYKGSPDPSAPPILLGQQTVVVTTQPGPGCNINNQIDFDITDGAPSTDRRVLLTRTMPAITGSTILPYPQYQSLLSRDRAIPIGLRTVVGGVQTSGIPVELRVVDPADPSPYIAGGPGIVQPVPGSQTGDNIGRVLPHLTGTGIVDNGNGTYSATSGSNGYVSAEMDLDQTHRSETFHSDRKTSSSLPFPSDIGGAFLSRIGTANVLL